MRTAVLSGIIRLEDILTAYENIAGYVKQDLSEMDG